jgi:hypothetical protein
MAVPFRRFPGATHGSVPALVALRTVFMSFVAAAMLIAVVVVVLVAGDSLGSAPLPLGVVLPAGLGVANIVLGLAIRSELPPDEDGLAAVYNTRFFLRVAMAEAPLLGGFVGVVLTGSVVPYLVGLVLAVPFFAVAAPMARNLARDQQVLRERGSEMDLVEVLMRPLQPTQ